MQRHGLKSKKKTEEKLSKIFWIYSVHKNWVAHKN